MGRIYSQSAKNVTVAANSELFSLYMNSNNAMAIIRRLIVSMTQVSLPAAQGLEFRAARLSAATQNTSGTNITAANIQKEDPGDANSAATLYVANTALSTGTTEWEWDDGCYLYTGRDIVFQFDLLVPKTRLFQVFLPNAPTGSPTPVINAVLEWEERGI